MSNYIKVNERSETNAMGFTETPDVIYDWVLDVAKAIKSYLKINSLDNVVSGFRSYRVNKDDNPNIKEEFEVLNFWFCNKNSSVENNYFDVTCMVAGENQFDLPREGINDLELYVVDMTEALHIYRMLLSAIPCKTDCDIPNEVNDYCWEGLTRLDQTNDKMYFDIGL